MTAREHDELCPEHPDWGFTDPVCHCLWIRVGRVDEREKIRPAWDADVDFANRMLVERDEALVILGTLRSRIEALVPARLREMADPLVSLSAVLAQFDK